MEPQTGQDQPVDPVNEVDESLALRDKRRPGDLMAPPTRHATMAQAFAGIMPQSIGEAMLLSRHLAQSNVIPWSMKGKPDTVLAIVMAGMELGLSPMRALNSISIISGNMAMKADLQLALARASGLMTYHDEGYELRGKSDTTLAKRIVDGLRLFLLQKGQGAVDAQERANLEGGMVFEQIQALVADLPNEKPYGWCIVRRGNDRLKPRVFTWTDADRVKLPKKKQRDDDQQAPDDEPQTDASRTLANQHQYKNWPQQMYPRRARGHLLAIEFGDVLMNMQPAENLEAGQLGAPVVDGEVVSHGAPAAGGVDVDTLLDEVVQVNPDLADRIVKAFSELQIPPAKQLHHLMAYRGQPDKLHDWMRDEYARQRGGEAAPPKGTGTGAKKTTGKARARGANHPEGMPEQSGKNPDPPAQTVTDSTGKPGTVGEHATTGGAVTKPGPVQPAGGGSVADRMKAAVTKTGKAGSF